MSRSSAADSALRKIFATEEHVTGATDKFFSIKPEISSELGQALEAVKARYFSDSSQCDIAMRISPSGVVSYGIISDQTESMTNSFKSMEDLARDRRAGAGLSFQRLEAIMNKTIAEQIATIQQISRIIDAFPDGVSGAVTKKTTHDGKDKYLETRDANGRICRIMSDGSVWRGTGPADSFPSRISADGAKEVVAEFQQLQLDTSRTAPRAAATSDVHLPPITQQQQVSARPTPARPTPVDQRSSDEQAAWNKDVVKYFQDTATKAVKSGDATLFITKIQIKDSGGQNVNVAIQQLANGNQKFVFVDSRAAARDLSRGIEIMPVDQSMALGLLRTEYSVIAQQETRESDTRIAARRATTHLRVDDGAIVEAAAPSPKLIPIPGVTTRNIDIARTTSTKSVPHDPSNYFEIGKVGTQNMCIQFKDGVTTLGSKDARGQFSPLKIDPLAQNQAQELERVTNIMKQAMAKFAEQTKGSEVGVDVSRGRGADHSGNPGGYPSHPQAVTLDHEAEQKRQGAGRASDARSQTRTRASAPSVVEPLA